MNLPPLPKSSLNLPPLSPVKGVKDVKKSQSKTALPKTKTALPKNLPPLAKSSLNLPPLSPVKGVKDVKKSETKAALPKNLPPLPKSSLNLPPLSPLKPGSVKAKLVKKHSLESLESLQSLSYSEPILPKDVYLYLTKFADDKTILNMLSVNKKFSDENFFEEVMKRKYPLLLEFKRGTWKMFYVRTIYYLAQLKENYGIPYIPVKGYNPIHFYKSTSLSDTVTRLKIALKWAGKSGDKEIVKRLIRLGANDENALNLALLGASERGHLDLVKYLVEIGANNFTWGLAGAAKGGHLEIVKFFIEKGASNFNVGMSEAAKWKHFELVKFFIEKGAEDFNGAMRSARQRPNNEDMIKFLENKLENKLKN